MTDPDEPEGAPAPLPRPARLIAAGFVALIGRSAAAAETSIAVK